MKSTLQILGITACIFMSAGCTSQTKEFKERKLIIASKETVKVKELNLTIINNGCGRKWISEGNNPSYERPYCDLVIKWKDSTIHAGGDSKPFYIGNIEIDIDRMNPWGREEDSIPPGGCRLWVRRVEGR